MTQLHTHTHTYAHTHACTRTFFFISFPLWFIPGYWIQFPGLYSRTLFIHSICDWFLLLSLRLPVHPVPTPPHLVNHKFALYVHECFRFVDRFVCVIFSILHVSDTGCTFKMETIETTGSDDILDIGYERRKESRMDQGFWLCKLEAWGMDLDVIWEFGSTNILDFYFMVWFQVKTTPSTSLPRSTQRWRQDYIQVGIVLH